MGNCRLGAVTSRDGTRDLNAAIDRIGGAIERRLRRASSVLQAERARHGHSEEGDGGAGDQAGRRREDTIRGHSTMLKGPAATDQTAHEIEPKPAAHEVVAAG